MNKIPAIILAGLLSANIAQAATVDGITFNTGAVFKIATVFEDRVTATGDTLSGIGEITTIFASNASTHTWDSGNNGRELTYTFGGFVLEKVVPGFGGGAQLYFSGGFAKFYSDLAQDFTATSGSKATDLTSASLGDLWLTVDAATQFSCVVADGCFSGGGTGITLISTVDSSSLGAVSSGSGNAFFNVTGGSAASFFDLNALAGGTDLKANFSFDTVLATDYDLSGSADIRTFAAPIPEPASLALIGIGMMFFSMNQTRRRNS